VVEADLAGLLDVELAPDAAAVGTDLDKIADQLLDARKIGADLVDLRALRGVESGGGRPRRRGGLRLPAPGATRVEPRRPPGATALRGGGFARGGSPFLRERRGGR